MSIAEAAKLYEVPYSTVYHHIRNYGCKTKRKCREKNLKFINQNDHNTRYCKVLFFGFNHITNIVYNKIIFKKSLYWNFYKNFSFCSAQQTLFLSLFFCRLSAML